MNTNHHHSSFQSKFDGGAEKCAAAGGGSKAVLVCGWCGVYSRGGRTYVFGNGYHSWACGDGCAAFLAYCAVRHFALLNASPIPPSPLLAIPIVPPPPPPFFAAHRTASLFTPHRRAAAPSPARACRPPSAGCGSTAAAASSSGDPAASNASSSKATAAAAGLDPTVKEWQFADGSSSQSSALAARRNVAPPESLPLPQSSSSSSPSPPPDAGSAIVHFNDTDTDGPTQHQPLHHDRTTSQQSHQGPSDLDASDDGATGGGSLTVAATPCRPRRDLYSSLRKLMGLDPNFLRTPPAASPVRLAGGTADPHAADSANNRVVEANWALLDRAASRGRLACAQPSFEAGPAAAQNRAVSATSSSRSSDFTPSPTMSSSNVIRATAAAPSSLGAEQSSPRRPSWPELAPPPECFTRRFPHDESPMEGVLGHFETRVLRPHLRICGICGEVSPMAIARAVEAICGVRVAAISALTSAYEPDQVVCILRDPETEAPLVRRALHKTAWMSPHALFWVRRSEPDDEEVNVAGTKQQRETAVAHRSTRRHMLGKALLAVAYAAQDERRWQLAAYARATVPGSRLPRRLVTCEEWV